MKTNRDEFIQKLLAHWDYNTELTKIAYEFGQKHPDLPYAEIEPMLKFLYEKAILHGAKHMEEFLQEEALKR